MFSDNKGTCRPLQWCGTSALISVHFVVLTRTTIPMGSRTPDLLLSTWTTPSALDLPLPRLQALPRPPPRPLVPLLVQAREHKRTGRAPRRSPLPPPLPRRLPRLRSNTPSPLCCASSLHRPALLPLILWSTELLVGRSLSLYLWPQGRAEPGLPLPSACGRCSSLAWGCLTMWQGSAGGCRGEGVDKSSKKEKQIYPEPTMLMRLSTWRKRCT